MTRHTPPRPVDVEKLFPELMPWRRETLRLHPRTGEPSCYDNSVGGPLLWPAEEPWPVCTEEHYTFDDGTPSEAEVSLVPIVQLHQADAPGVAFPPGCDLLQVLWCPFNHGELFCPLPRVYWRAAGDVGAVHPTPAAPADAEENHVADPCVVHPEQVTEYPSHDLPNELATSLEQRFDRLEEETGWFYYHHLADAPGIKVGGYPGWTQDPVWPDCTSCGQAMEHLLTVASGEFDGSSWFTWLPVEDRPAAESDAPLFDSETASAAVDSPGLTLGDMGGVYIFECRSCPERPIDHWFDCS
ncbi:YwqG family protein [Salinactinospora qingdaonensis]|uniref:DUF1963 domain-containing protein n=1 Tax=Salinactinospora qingdaonensis TaxID=702744 RepID=A0ABP7GK98_9ACTN